MEFGGLPPLFLPRETLWTIESGAMRQNKRHSAPGISPDPGSALEIAEKALES